jgi:acyl transferase domain-containing protein/NADPH:quinone reductase-like Zn-dependent oxidoreductase/acyl carrier protein
MDTVDRAYPSLFRLLRQLLAESVGIDSIDLDPDERFSHYGLDSLKAAGFIARLGENLGRSLPATLVWDYPTLNHLARFLAGDADTMGTLAASAPGRRAAAEPIAVIAVACRVPGAADVEAFWRLLLDGTDAVGPMPEGRWPVAALYDPDPEAPGRMATRWGGFLQEIDRFDAEFFGISPREAWAMDPQQRLVLELAWEALERAGIVPSRLAGSRTGVFIGAMWSEYGQLFSGLEDIVQHSATGRDTAIIANRISYRLGLTGPSLTVNTACSSALAAVHLACQSLRDGESSLALAGGVNLILTADSTVAMTKFGAMAPDGRCKAFDAGANGYVRGEGAGVVVLKPLTLAQRDGDPVLAVIRGSAMNNDGPSNGLTAPNPEAQRAMLRDAYARAGVAAADVDFVEAHGTGTFLGDPIEAAALGAVLGKSRGAERPLILGSAKTNVGHLEAAAGVVGLIKTTLALHHRRIPPSLHFLSPNPNIDFAADNLRVPVTSEPWPEQSRPGVAGVSSFGFGGTNVHVVLEAWPGEDQSLAVASSMAVIEDEQASGRPLVFVCSGNGAYWLGMGRDLLAAAPAFRAGVAACDAAFRSLTEDWRVFDAMLGDPGKRELTDNELVQGLTFSVQVGLSCLLSHWGYSPAALVGHSLGEVTVAWIAGVLSLQDAARVVYHRSRAQAEVSGDGAMAQVDLSWQTAEKLLRDHPGVVVSGANAPSTVTLSGAKPALAKVMFELEQRGVGYQPIRVDIAFHSPAMTQPSARLIKALAGLRPCPERMPIYSTVTGRSEVGGAFDADYWGRNLREPVRFADAIAALSEALPEAVFLELSAHSILAGSVTQCLLHASASGSVLSTMERHESAAQTLRRLRAQLEEHGLTPQSRRPPRRLHLLTLSARSREALRSMALCYRDALPEALADACYSANTGREPLAERVALMAETAEAMRAQLQRFIDTAPGLNAPGIFSGSIRPGRRPDVSLYCAKDLPRLTGLARLYATEPTFAEIISQLDRVFLARLGARLADWLADAPTTLSLRRAWVFGIQVGLGRLLACWGVRAYSILGDGPGAMAAEVLQGNLSEEAALEQVLTGMSARIAATEPADGLRLRLNEIEDAWAGLLGVLGQAYVSGLTLDWSAFDRFHPRRRLILPTYPFQRRRFWPTPAVRSNADIGLYELAWTAIEPPCRELAEPQAVLDALPSIEPLTGQGRAISALPRLLDELAAAYAAKALNRVSCVSAQAAYRQRQFDALRRLAAQAQSRDVAALAAQISHHHPQATEELAVIRRVGEALPSILAEAIDPLQVLFPDGATESLQSLYADSPFARVTMAWVANVFSQVPDIRSVVEIGGGTGGATGRALAALPADVRYLFTDVSEAFLEQARVRFVDHQGFAALRFDVEQPAVAQGLGERFDAVLAVNVLHATRDLGKTLTHVRSLLHHGGWLVLVEVTGRPGWLDLVFGCLEGWWRFADSERRTNSALLPPDAWREVLQGSGFDRIAMRGDGDRQSLILARACAPVESWLLLGDPLRTAALAKSLRSAGVAVTEALSPPEQGDWRETLVLDTDITPVAACGQVAALMDDARFGRLRLVETPVLDDALTVVRGARRGWLMTRGLTEPARWGGALRGGDAAALAQALLADAGESLLEVAAGSWQGLRLRPLAIVDGGLPVRSDATYLISGGLGALGLAFARWLVARGARYLALLGRRPPSIAGQRVLDELTAQGAKIQTFAVDVTQVDALRSMIATLAGESPAIAGVIHAAGLASDDAAEAIAVKLGGAEALQAVTAEIEPEVFLLFSSASGVWGAKGKAAYAAGNAALDAFAQRRRRQGLPVLSVAWGRFAERGLLSAAEDAALAQMGLGAMDPAAAFDIAWRLTAGDRCHAVIAAVDWPRFRSVYEARVACALLAELPAATPEATVGDLAVPPAIAGSTTAKHPAPTSASAQELSADAILARLRQLVAQVLGYADSEALDVDRGLFEQGLDSLLAIRLRQRMEQAFARPIASATLFAHPTITALAEWLAPAPAAAPAALSAPPETRQPSIAVIGAACRFPGGIINPQGFAEALFQGQDLVGEVPTTRWDWREWCDDDADRPGYMVSRWGGFLSDIDQFDAQFFHLSPKEAAYMDPQQRLLLEVAWEAFEGAGMDPKGLQGARVGVFIGITGSDYATLARRGGAEHLEAQAISGQPNNTAAGRIAFSLGLVGPALAVDTACSSSLVAIHLACQALRNGECDLALAGGVNLTLAPETSVILSRAGMLSPTGRCRTFDAAADGFVRAEGCGLVVLKPLQPALDDGDPVRAVVRGSAVNHDGRASGFTVPNGSAQQRVIEAALRDAQLAPSDIQYVEVHGTGTALGDPIEAQALIQALGQGRSTPLVVGSVKTNIGHAESAAGIAGFIKTVLALEAKRIPANLHFSQLNPHIDLADTPLLIPRQAIPWPNSPGRRFAGVSSFGASGTNAHVIIGAAPDTATEHLSSNLSGVTSMPRILPLSAGSPEALARLAADVAMRLEDKRLADIAYSAGLTRASLPLRGFAVFRTAVQGRAALADMVAAKAQTSCKIAFLCTGQGVPFGGVAPRLYAAEPRFRAVIDRCDALAAPLLGLSLRSLLLETASQQQEVMTALAQPALFTLGCALAELWRSWGIAPAALVGHSVGEYTAAVIAGALDLEAGLALVIRRGQLMQGLSGGGGMYAVRAPLGEFQDMLDEEPEVAVAALNGPASTVLSGPLSALDRLRARLAGKGLRGRRLAVSHGFHSALLEPMLDAFEAQAAGFDYRQTAVPVMSNLTGEPVTTFDATYWRRQARETVRFADGLQAAAALGCRLFIEMGPQPVLSLLVNGIVDDAVAVASLRGRDRDDLADIYDALGRAWQAGVGVDWQAVAPDGPHRRVPLPTTPFQRKRHWLDWIDTRRRSAFEPDAVQDWVYAIAWEDRGELPAMAPDDGQANAVVSPAWRQTAVGWILSADLTAFGVADVARLCAELAQRVAQADRPVWVVTRGAQSVSGAETAVDFSATALWGLGRILALRHPTHWGGLLDLDPEREVPTNLEPLLALLADRVGEDQLALRNGRCYVPRLTSTRRAWPPPRPVRSDRSYLITGGLGGLGLALARYLAACGARHLLLLGRRPPNERAAAILQALSQQGVSVKTAALDVADTASMTRFGAGVEQSSPPVAAIFHAAGVKDGDFAAVLRPKLAGIQELHRISRHWPLEDFVLFSSAAAVWGDRQLAAYGAANAALDGFSHWRRAQGLPASSLNWGRFTERGMLDAAGAVLLERMGLRPLPTEAAFTLMRRVMAAAVTQLVLADVDWSVFKPIYEGHQPRPLLAQLVAKTAPPAVSAPGATTNRLHRPALVAWLREQVAQILGRDDPEELDLSRGFFTLGLDSFGVVDLRRRIEIEFGLALPASALFETSSIIGLAERLTPDTEAVAEHAPLLAARPETLEIAVVGVGLRLPGGVRDLAGLADLICRAVDAVGDLPQARAAHWHAGAADHQGGWLTDIDAFDADYFAISPREAAQIDPQHRLLLEVAWEALQHSGWSPPALAGSSTGVFVGITGTEYGRLRAASGRPDAHAVGGQFLNVAAGRISHALGLNGPSVAVDTACSSSAMAVHLACQALRAGECDQALAGGVNLLLTADTTAMLRAARMLAADGRCKTFDEAADGYVRAEGCGLVVLKPLARAEAAGDRVLAVIRGSAANHDGAASGFTVPNGLAQQAVIRTALRQAGVAPAAVSYVEAHGTGTALGDPVELHALDAVYGEARQKPLWVGSIKTQIGHAEAAAGVAGLLRLIACLQLRCLPPHLHFRRLNPHIRVPRTRVAVAAAVAPWESTADRRLAGLSAFGASGTNVHLIVEEGQDRSVVCLSRQSQGAAVDKPVTTAVEGDEAVAAQGAVSILAVSSRRAEDLLPLAEIALQTEDWRAACRELALTGDGQQHRLALVADGREDMRRALNTAVCHAAGQPRVAFLFTGQGAQYPGMGRQLYASEAVFRQAVDQCARAAAGYLAWPLTDLLLDADRALLRTEEVQPAMFTFGYGLAALWRSWGVEPAAVLGHSLGELTAACVAGAMSLTDALALVIERGRLMGDLPPGGAMAAALTSPEALAPLLDASRGRVSVAAYNGPENTVLSGDEAALLAVLDNLRKQGIEVRSLAVSHAFHSPLMAPMLADLEVAASRVNQRIASIPLVANVDGQVRHEFDAAYWRAQAANPVHFSAGMATLAKLGCDLLIEIGPHPVLCAMGRSCIQGGEWLASQRRGEPLARTLAVAATTAWRLGAPISWTRFLHTRPRDNTPLPSYPFRRSRHWLASANSVADSRCGGGWFQTRLDSPALPGEVRSERLAPEDIPGLEDSGGLLHVGLHLALLAAALGQVETAPITLDQAAFPRALWLDQPHELQIVRYPDGRVRLFARKGDDENWRQHFHAKLVGDDESQLSDAVSLGEQPWREAEQRGLMVMSGEAFYADLSRRGFSLGPRLRRIARVWRKSGQALAQLDPPAADDPLAFGLPAALIEACAQLPVAACPDRAGSYMVVGWKRFQRSAIPYRSARWLQVTVDCGAAVDQLSAEVLLSDAEGRLLARLQGLQLMLVETAMAVGAHLAVAASPPPWIGDAWWEPVSNARDPAAAVACRLFPTGSATELLAERLRAADPQWFTEAAEAVVILMESAPAAETAALARLLGIIESLPAETRLLLFTLGVWLPGRRAGALAPGGAGLWGLAQALQVERADLAVRCVDCDASALADCLRRELADPGAETATAWRRGERFALRLRARRPLESWPEPLALTYRSDAGGVAWRPRSCRVAGAGEITIEVIAAGVDFRDLLVVHERLPATLGLGAECSGRVLAVGPDVTKFGIGDAVMAYVPDGAGALTSAVTLEARFARSKPAALSFPAAATVPVAYLTAWYGLMERGGLQPEETVLIHAAGSSVGWAAMAIARWRGARILTTAGQHKRDSLRSLGIDVIGDSRSPTFVEAVRRASGGRGVDLAFGAFADLAGVARQVLANDGRLLDLTRRNGAGEVDLDRLAQQQPTTFGRIFDTISGGIKDGWLPPIAHSVTPWNDAPDIFPAYAQGGILGRHCVRLAAEPPVAPSGTWLVSGSSGGLGAALCQHLAERGLKYLVMLDRAAPSADRLQRLAALGVAVRPAVLDIADEGAMTNLFATLPTDWPPLNGIVHAAALTEDGRLGTLEAEHFERVFRPKVVGARLLDRLSQGCPLRVFALFDSVVALLPSAGQGAYAAANAALALIARQRRARGVPATAIHWGPWASGIGQGMGERAEAVWRSWGVTPLTESAGLSLVDALLGDDGDAIVLNIDWDRYLGQLAATPPGLIGLGTAVSERDAASHAAPESAPPALTAEAVDGQVRAALAAVLGHTAPESIDGGRTFSEQGVDSLLATELASSLGTRLGLRLPATLVYHYPTLNALVDELSKRLLPAAVALEIPSGTASTVTDSADLLRQLESKLDDIDRLLEAP